MFLGIEHRLSNGLALELDGLGSLGRKLITTDAVNRRTASYRPVYENVYYRANQGLSSYYALAAVARYRTGRAQAQVAYTWSHTIDNQSDPLAGEFFDLNFGVQSMRYATFSQQFDSRGDRGNADFDQRHNLVFHSTWELPWKLRGWRVSQLGAFRSGYPYSVYAFTPGTASRNTTYLTRANLTGQPLEATGPEPEGGRLLLARNAFAPPPLDKQGDTGRNAFRGPGFYNLDLSVARTLALPRTERARLTLRADIFNVLNHANLDIPESIHGAANFGVAQYGRRGRDAGFPALIPFDERARQIQLLLRLEF
jgi:hypothetical protein